MLSKQDLADLAKLGSVSVTDFDKIPRLDTGSLNFNAATQGGYPIGYISCLSGLEGSGKTTLASISLMTTIMRGDGWGAWVAAEKGFNTHAVYKASGLVPGKDFYLSHPESAESAAETVRFLLKRDKPPKIIVLDSLVGMKPAAVLESTLFDAKMMLRSRIIAEFMEAIEDDLLRKEVVLIVINQVRANTKKNSKYDPDFIRPGGKAKDHYIRLGADLFAAEHDTSPIGILGAGKGQKSMSKTLLEKGVKSMYLDGLLFKNTFGPHSTFRIRIAHDPHLMIDRIGEIADWSRRLCFVSNKAGGPLGANGHWYMNGEKIASDRSGACEWLVAHPEPRAELEKAIQQHFIDHTSLTDEIYDMSSAEVEDQITEEESL